MEHMFNLFIQFVNYLELIPLHARGFSMLWDFMHNV